MPLDYIYKNKSSKKNDYFIKRFESVSETRDYKELIDGFSETNEKNRNSSLSSASKYFNNEDNNQMKN